MNHLYSFVADHRRKGSTVIAVAYLSSMHRVESTLRRTLTKDFGEPSCWVSGPQLHMYANPELPVPGLSVPHKLIFCNDLRGATVHGSVGLLQPLIDVPGTMAVLLISCSNQYEIDQVRDANVWPVLSFGTPPKPEIEPGLPPVADDDDDIPPLMFDEVSQ